MGGIVGGGAGACCRGGKVSFCRCVASCAASRAFSRQKRRSALSPALRRHSLPRMITSIHSPAAVRHHVLRGAWCCYRDCGHPRSRVCEAAASRNGRAAAYPGWQCSNTPGISSKLQRKVLTRFGSYFVHSHREDIATDCVTRAARCVDLSIRSEAEPRTFSCWHRQAPLGACAAYVEHLARPLAVSSVAYQGDAPQNTRGTALSRDAAS